MSKVWVLGYMSLFGYRLGKTGEEPVELSENIRLMGPNRPSRVLLLRNTRDAQRRFLSPDC